MFAENKIQRFPLPYFQLTILKKNNNNVNTFQYTFTIKHFFLLFQILFQIKTKNYINTSFMFFGFDYILIYVRYISNFLIFCSIYF